MRPAEARRARPARGFTLLEMLVTLVIVSVVTTLLWQALALTARLEQSLARSSGEGGEMRLQQAWVRQALQGLAVPPGVAQPLQGDELRLRAYTTQPPWPDAPGPEAFVLEIQPSSDGQSPWRLQAQRELTGERLDLGAWPVDTRWRYLDSAGQWHRRWPPADQERAIPTRQRPLPAIVGLTPMPPSGSFGVSVAAPPGSVLLVAPAASRNPMLARAQAAPADDPR
ncbi:prepilin-type N-terminal cleavage/methylation domain-containing protein [Rubrivivax sp. JA1024]|nr:prepilin-type N-terminal cleavage/methylation domain-containing protein [Rubrivivax sp. JA1024]